MNDSWTQKKNTSNTILKNKWIREMDTELFENKSVFAHKLCGAGNGGFFLTFSKKEKLDIPFECVKIGVETIFIFENQKDLQRPIFFDGKNYIVCRPPDKVLEYI